MMRVLWLCSLVLPDFSQEFGIKKVNTGGWMTGMLHALEKTCQVDISLCFPIYEKHRLKKGIYNNHRYYTFLCDSMEAYNNTMIESFEQILEVSKPEVIHIWGSEFAHTTAMLWACKNKGMLNRAVISIQGLISVISKHYIADVPEKYRMLRVAGGTGIDEMVTSCEKRGNCEIESLKMVRHVIGRTDWDRACTEAVNANICYHFCDEILRDIFYECKGKWKYNECEKYSIFVSQAASPIKGFHYLLQALPLIIRKYPNTHVYAAGRNIFNIENKQPYIMYLNQLIDEFELKEHISFLGRLNEEQMVKQYLKANVFVLPSAIENSSNSLNEAKIIGVPTVGAFTGGTSNRVVSGKDGFLYPHNEPALLAFYICKIFRNEDDLCTKFSTNSVQQMTKFIEPKLNAERTLLIYELVAKESVRGTV